MVALCNQARACGERSVCNSELNQTYSVGTPCHINLKTTVRNSLDTDMSKRFPSTTSKIKKAATHTAEQGDDANSSDDFAK